MFDYKYETVFRWAGFKKLPIYRCCNDYDGTFRKWKLDSLDGDHLFWFYPGNIPESEEPFEKDCERIYHEELPVKNVENFFKWIHPCFVRNNIAIVIAGNSVVLTHLYVYMTSRSDCDNLLDSLICATFYLINEEESTNKRKVNWLDKSQIWRENV